MEKTCGGCGQPFDARRSNQKYCSADCKRTAENRRREGAENVVPPGADNPPQSATADEMAAALVAVRLMRDEGYVLTAPRDAPGKVILGRSAPPGFGAMPADEGMAFRESGGIGG